MLKALPGCSPCSGSCSPAATGRAGAGRAARRHRPDRPQGRRPAPAARLPGRRGARADGRYRLGVGASLPPLLLDEDEAVAVAVGLRAATGITGIEETSARALAKLDSVLPHHLQRQVAAIHGAVLTGPENTGSNVEDPVVDVGLLTALAAAIRDHEEVRFDYQARQRLQVEPYRLVVWQRRWYLVARDARTDTWAPYRVDWLRLRTPGGARFSPVELPGGDYTSFVLREVARFERLLHLGARLADAGEHHPRRIDAGGQHALELAARDDVEAAAGFGEGLQHGQAGVGLHRVADQVVAAGERALLGRERARASRCANRRTAACRTRAPARRAASPRRRACRRGRRHAGSRAGSSGRRDGEAGRRRCRHAAGGWRGVASVSGPFWPQPDSSASAASKEPAAVIVTNAARLNCDGASTYRFDFTDHDPSEIVPTPLSDSEYHAQDVGGARRASRRRSTAGCRTM